MKKLKKYLESINLNYKLELIQYVTILVISLIMMVFFIFQKQFTLAAVILFVPVLFIFLKLFQYSFIKDKRKLDQENEFVNLVNYLEIFISNKFNIYNAFIEAKNYSSPWMRQQIDTLLNDIDNDKSVEPFIKFAKNFKKPIVENVMVALFQMMEEGENSNQLNQFDILFQRFSENYHQAKVDKKSRDIESLATYPLVGAGFVTLILTLGIMSIMGEIINVI